MGLASTNTQENNNFQRGQRSRAKCSRISEGVCAIFMQALTKRVRVKNKNKNTLES